MIDSNDNRDGLGCKILIRKKKNYFKRKEIIKLVLFIVILLVGGALGGKYTADKIINKKLQEEINLMDTNYKNNIEEIPNSISKVSLSLVTISNEYSKLTNNNISESNITGVIVDKKGYIITNYSKIKDYEKIYVKLPSIATDPIEAKYIGEDEDLDIAMVKIDSEGLIPINIASKDSFREGDIVLAVGNAISDDYVGIAVPGIITSDSQTIMDQSSGNLYNVIQTNAIINSDNTGGVLCNLNGEVVGFNSSYLSDNFNKIGFYYALGVRGIIDSINNLISLTDILGIDGGTILETEKTDVSGVYINSIKPDGYASKCGMKPSDIIISIDGKNINHLEDIYYIIKDKKY